ncbi:MAG: sigma-70 family RNA polymerase sigma factor [Nanoarchaeota archaeon]|nr:sigma-70 family RNA polymerase sigma factor [Nanoarchaeota archaeon]MBU1444841.1 sigma-70 family RNA polymerase sigma factor [Nanoarchaeota archaeon]MBU2406944.1 sigma-70 family RNA polymerase sigma factor [Nanoarchaeota archaeon]MBU2420009.1 sigma-70 family RNA polymerase sigma factor [Nanoarchaeota archaeon]MBU2475424.1 sigma-70 family RNA polymerase sigma factor [Nanoarchaeota archaeon]
MYSSPLQDPARISNSELREYVREILKYPRSTREEEIELGRGRRDGDAEARDALVMSNLWFPVYHAWPYAYSWGRDQESREESCFRLSEEGNLGLVIAANKFDERHGVRFTSFAKWEIDKAIFDFFKQCGQRVINVSHYRANLVKKVKGTIEYLLTKEGRIPSAEEISNMLGDISVNVVKSTLKVYNSVELSFDREDSEEETLHDEFYFHDGRDIWTRLTRESLGEALDHAMGGLNPQERSFLTLRYLEGKDNKEIAKLWNVTPSRVREVKPLAKEKFRKRLAYDPLFRELGMDYLID